MIHKRLKVLILSAAFLSLPGVQAYDWKPTGDEVDANGYAITNGEYADGDRIQNTAPSTGGGGEGEDSQSMRKPKHLRNSKMFRHNRRVASPVGYRTDEGGPVVVTAGGNTQFEATPQDNVLNIYGTLNGAPNGAKCPLKLDGDITLKALTTSMTVNLKTPVTLMPYIDPTAVADDGTGGNFQGLPYAQLQFEVGAGKTIEFNVDHNLEFEAKTLAGNGTSFEPRDMLVSFKGQGQVIFKMADGTAIKLNGMTDDTFKVDMLNRDPEKDLSIDGVANNAGGTKFLICMDQTKADAEKGLNKVVFQRKALAQENKRNMIYVGVNSGFFYVSDDITGKDQARGGYGSVAFDVSNRGAGRMVLFLQGARDFGWQVQDDQGNLLYAADEPEFKKVAYRYLFNDAAFVVAGHKVENYTPAKIRETLNYSVPAGVKAIMRVIDDLAYSNRAQGAPYNPTAADRRGLLLVNDTETIAKLGSDNYWDFWQKPTSGGGEGEGEVAMGLRRSARTRSSEESSAVTQHGHDWSYAAGVADQVNLRNVRTGFVLGVNGSLDVYSNTQLDYVAATGNRVDDLALNDYQEWDKDSKTWPKDKKAAVGSRGVLAMHNPSALVVDSLDQKLFAESLLSFDAANTALTEDPVRAEIILRGNAGVIMRACASQNLGYMEKFWQLAAPGDVGMRALRSAGYTGLARKLLRKFRTRSGENEGGTPDSAVNPIDMADLNWDEVLTIGEAKFNGYSLDKITVKNPDTNTTEDVSSAEGMIVLDVEGALVVRSLANNSIVDMSTGAPRAYASVVNGAGWINAATTKIDHTGNTVTARPLALNSMQACYNSPVVYMNATMTLDGATLRHSDVTKLVDGVPTHSRPAIKGGERMFFSDNLFTFDGTHSSMRFRIPELRLDNGALALQESLNMAGVRLVATDRNLTTDNNSVVRFYDHGAESDSKFTGYGRLLMLGSNNNTMVDGTSNWVTESAYVNVFKQRNGQNRVALNLSIGDQFPASVEQADYNNQRGLHLILSSIMEKGGTNVAIGWNTVHGALRGTSYPYGSTRYEKDSTLKEVLPSDAALKFSVDALNVPAAEIVADKGLIGFSGFDKDGNSAKTPISANDAQGVVYVNHGGKLSVNDADLVVDTMVAQRIWNDYNAAGDTRLTWLSGIVDLPHDQSTFTSRGGVQAFGLTKEMFGARDNTGGWVRMSFDNPNRSKADRSGAEEVVVNWHNPEGYLEAKADPTRSLAKHAKTRGVRVTTALNEPIVRPDGLLYIGSNDDIRQLRVAGATSANPLKIEISGDENTRAYGRVREFASVPSQVDLNTGRRVDEGAHAVIFGTLGGRFGLGTTNWNDHSVNPWNILGKDYVQVAPEGDCVVDVNSNLIIGDGQALVAEEEFGRGQVHRITFTSETEREIRIPSGVELDLSTFGQGDKRQEIAFGGRVKLVMEQGATIRGPRNPNGGLVLYFNDEAQFVFEAPSDRAAGNKPFSSADNAAVQRVATQAERAKLMGQFQIWLNKSAAMQVGDGVLVGVQSDARTQRTDITVSLSRESRFNIGSAVSAGGAFEVGNPVAVTGGSVNFELASRGVSSVFHIDRQGFLGLGAGVLEKQGNMNGIATSANNPVLEDGKAKISNGAPVFTPDKTVAWKVAPLFNVDKLSIAFTAGRFEHNNIADGSDVNAALIAVGPATNYRFRMSAPGQVVVKGGGNLMYVPAAAKDGVRVNVWDYAGSFGADAARYNIMASAPILFEREDVARDTFNNSGFDYKFTNGADFFNLLSFRNYGDQKTKFAAAGPSTSAPMRVAFANLDAENSKYPADAAIIVRNDVNAVQGGTVADALFVGVAAGIETNAVGPTSFGVPAR